MQDSCSSPSSFVHQSITPRVSTVVDQGCVTAASPLRHHYVVLLPISTAAGFGQAQIALRPGQWRKCRTLSPMPPLKNGAAVRGSRLKIATNVAGVLGSSEAPFSLARMEINGAQRGTRSS